MPHIARIAIFALLSISAAAPAARAQQHSFSLHHFLSELTPVHADMLAPWAARVEELSGGRVEIVIYPSMTLGGRPAELIGQARDGVADMVWTANGYTPGLFPRTEVFELPSVYRNDPAAANLAIRTLYDDWLAPEYQGLKVLWVQVHTGNGIHTAETEARSPADLAGLSLRTPSRTGAWVIEALGANPVAMPVPDLPQALSRGAVDGALLPWDIVTPLKLQRQARVQIDGHEQARFGTTAFQLSMNLARWDALPPDIQRAFIDATDAEWLEDLGHIWRQADDAGIAASIADGADYYRLSAEETAAFDAALAPVTERWVADTDAAGIDGAALVEAARDAIAAHADGGS